MLRLIGCMCVFAGCGGAGWYLAGMGRRRLRILEEMEGVLQRIQGQIQYAGCDMGEIFEKLEEESTYFSGVWKHMARRLKEGQKISLWEIWREEWQRKGFYRKCGKFMGQEERYLLQEIGRSLGQTDRIGQLHMLEMYRNRLHKIQENTEKQDRQNAKVYRVAGVTAGCFLIILLL